ncbi:MAG: ComF family protein, partial [Acidobacteriota bacterium]
MCALRSAVAALEVFLPAECPCCQGPMPGMHRGLCTRCRSSLVPMAGLRCCTCGGPIDDPADPCVACVADPTPQRGTVVWGEYDGTLRDAVLTLKHRGHDEVGTVLASRLAARLSLEPWIEEITVVTAVPSHPLHRLRRGFNGAEILARSLACAIDRPFRVTLRRHGLSRQASRSRSERKRLQARRFSVPRPAAIQEQTVLLIDDVITTGTTLRRAVQALLNGGASEVYAGALGFTPDPRRMG